MPNLDRFNDDAFRPINFNYQEPKSNAEFIGLCGCGCKSRIYDNEVYTEFDEVPFIDFDHVEKSLKEQGRLVEVG